MWGLGSEEDAFRNSVESITGPISRIISREGMPGVYNALDEAGKKEFEKASPATAPMFRPAGEVD